MEIKMKTSNFNKQDICANCGHLYLLHLNNFKSECDVCDDPTIPIEKKCPGFKLKEKKLVNQR